MRPPVAPPTREAFHRQRRAFQRGQAVRMLLAAVAAASAGDPQRCTLFNASMVYNGRSSLGKVLPVYEQALKGAPETGGHLVGRGEVLHG